MFQSIVFSRNKSHLLIAPTHKHTQYAFEISDPVVEDILAEARVHPASNCRTVTLCQKDSQEITNEDRQNLQELICQSPESSVLVTHGTDTMIETAQAVQEAVKAHGKTVVFTGSIKPYSFKDSDAAFNVGMVSKNMSLTRPHPCWRLLLHSPPSRTCPQQMFLCITTGHGSTSVTSRARVLHCYEWPCSFGTVHPARYANWAVRVQIIGI